MKKLAIITTHPIQYYAPLFQLLTKKINIKIFYTAGNDSLEKYDIGFKQKVKWDIDLLSEYEYEFLENTAKSKGSHHFFGIKNPDAIAKINAYQPDAILVYGWSYWSHLTIMYHFKGKIPVYFRGDSTLLDQQLGFKNILKSIFLKWVYHHVDAAFYVGQANKSYFKKYGLKTNQLVFAPHAIDNDRFAKHRNIEAKNLREKLAIESDHILILFAGKLEPKKNPMLLLNAFLQLKDEKAHLLFVGNGVLEESLKLKVKSLKSGVNGPELGVHSLEIEGGVPKFQVESSRLKVKSLEEDKSLLRQTQDDNLSVKNEKQKTNIHFMDFQNQTQMPAIYQACDLFCLPSKGPGETWGLAVNEAMACGKAILVSDKVGCAEDLVNEQNGCVFESENLIDLTQKLIALTNDQYILKKMGENSVKNIQNWSFERQVNAISTYVNR